MIWLIAGGSGGHLLPAISMYYYLKKRGVDCRLFYEDKPVLSPIICAFADLRADAFPMLDSARRRPKDFLFSVKNLWKRLSSEADAQMPDIIVSFGGQAGAVAGIWASFHKIDLYLHEQNARMGVSNAVLAGLAKGIFCGFSNCQGPFFARDKIIMTGNFFALPEEIPLVEEDTINLPKNVKKWILVMGGSQGASALNRNMPYALAGLEKDVGVIHLCGLKDLVYVKEEYIRRGRTALVLDFFVPVWPLYSKIDLMISRAGAMTVSEACLFGLPTIFVPYPYAGAHQMENISFLASQQMCKVVEQKKGWQERVAIEAKQMLEDAALRKEMSEKMKGAFLCNREAINSAFGL